jgi:hypothetical protein
LTRLPRRCTLAADSPLVCITARRQLATVLSRSQREGVDMNRVAAIVAMSVFTVFAAVATAQAATPPTLSGESFHEDLPTVTSVTCNQNLGGAFQASGTATGPYPGTFQETGEVLATTDGMGHVTGSDLTAAFVIDSSTGHVTGSKSSTNVAVSCGGQFLSFNTSGATYNARILTASGAFADNGFVSVSFANFSGGGGFNEGFDSTLPTPQQLFPTSKDQCKGGGWRNFPQFKNQGQCVEFVEHAALATCLAERIQIGREAFRVKYGEGRRHRHARLRCLELHGG